MYNCWLLGALRHLTGRYCYFASELPSAHSQRPLRTRYGHVSGTRDPLTNSSSTSLLLSVIALDWVVRSGLQVRTVGVFVHMGGDNLHG